MICVQVDMQGQILHREVTAMNKKLDGETTRRSFVSRQAVNLGSHNLITDKELQSLCLGHDIH